MDDQQFAAFLRRAVQELKEKQQFLRDKYRFESFARWWFDQETATLQFFDAEDRLGCVAEFVEIGSFSPVSSTWRWAWCNNSVLPHLRQKAANLQELEGITGVKVFRIENAFKIEEGMAWDFAALAILHLSAAGCYRAPAADCGPFIFMSLTNIHLAD